MANIGNLRIGIQIAKNKLQASLQEVNNAFKKTGDNIEKSLGSKTFNKLKQKAKETTKTIGGLNDRLRILKNKLQEVEIGSKEFKKLQKEIKKTEEKLNKATGASSGFLSKLKSFGPLIATYFGASAFAGFVKGALQASASLEQANISFQTLLGNKQLADQMMADIEEFASKTPFSRTGLTEMTQQLIGMGIQADMALPTLQILGDSLSALGRSQEDLKGVVLALGQIQAKGKLSTEEVLQMAERGLPIFEILEKQLGLTKKQLGDLGNQGIDSATAINAILVGLNEKFAGAMEKQSRTLAGKWSNFKDNLEIITGKIGNSIRENAKNILDIINNFMEQNFNKIVDFGSSAFMFIKDIISGFWDVVQIVINQIGEIFSFLFNFWVSGTEKSTGESIPIWKKLFMFISLGIQMVVGIVNTFLKTITGSIKASGTLIGNLTFSAIQSISLFVKNIANGIIGFINNIIEGINRAVSFLGGSSFLKPLDDFDTKFEEIALKQQNTWKDTKEAFDLKGIIDSNKKSIGKMVDTIKKYDVSIKNSGKKSSLVWTRNNKKIGEMKNLLKKYGKAGLNTGNKISKGVSKANKSLKKHNDLLKQAKKLEKEREKQLKQREKQVKKSIELIRKEYEDYHKDLEKLEKLRKENAQKTIEYNYETARSIKEVKDNIDKLNISYDEQIKKLEEVKNKKLEEINKDTNKNIAEKYLDIKNKQKELEIKKAKKLIELEEKRKKLEEKLKNNKYVDIGNKIGTKIEELKKQEKILKSILDKKIYQELEKENKNKPELKYIIEYRKQKEKLEKQEKDFQRFLDEQTLEKVKKYKKLSEAEKIIFDRDKKIKEAQEEEKRAKEQAKKQFEEKKQALERELKIREFFKNKEIATREELNKLLQDKKILNLKKEEQDLIISLAKRKIELTNSANEELNLKRKIASEIVILNQKITNLQLKNIDLLKQAEKDLTKTIASELQKRAELYNLSGINTGGIILPGINQQVINSKKILNSNQNTTIQKKYNININAEVKNQSDINKIANKVYEKIERETEIGNKNIY